jgi:alkanesulfonate monooxygenase SsuD/methylene tetrahydromethanopterin reductase-like flavin-dependent oxidoreductase (luciferase family)
VELGLYISGQHPGGSMADHLRDHLAQVRAAREAGFRSVFAGHHYFSNPYQQFHPVPLLARIAAESGDMLIGAGVLLTGLLNPVDVCEQVTTLDAISGGRFVLGVGLGYRDVEYAAFGVPKERRVRIFTENLQTIKRLWMEPHVDAVTDRYRLDHVSWPTPPEQRPHPPIWIAANNDPAVRRAARLGDTWIINPHARLDVLKRQLDIYKRELESLRKPFPKVLPIIRDAYVAETTNQALADARPFLEAKYKTYVAWGQDRALPAGEDRLDLPFESLRGDRFLVGDPDEVTEQVARLREALAVNHLILRMQWPGADNALPSEKTIKSIELIGRHVLPVFRQPSRAT